MNKMTKQVMELALSDICKAFARLVMILWQKKFLTQDEVDYIINGKKPKNNEEEANGSEEM